MTTLKRILKETEKAEKILTEGHYHISPDNMDVFIATTFDLLREAITDELVPEDK